MQLSGELVESQIETQLTEAGCRQRVSELIDRLSGECGLVILSDSRHIGYMSGFFSNPATVNQYSQSFLIIETDGCTTLITDNWQEDAANTSQANEVELYEFYEEQSPAQERHSVAVQILLRRLSTLNPSPPNIGIESQALSHQAREGLMELFPRVVLSDIRANLVEMRQRKHEDELDCIQRAIRAAEAGFAAIHRELHPGMTELDAFSVAQRAALTYLAEPVWATGDFVSGIERTTAMGGIATKRVMQAGDLFIVDFGLIAGGYWADLSNTFLVGQQPNELHLYRFEILRKAVQVAEGELRAGAKAREIFEKVDTFLMNENVQASKDEQLSNSIGLRHHLGHGIGLHHLEPPFLVRNSEERLHAGNIITIEPGLYMQGWGGMRIEDNYLITENGFECLSKHLKHL